MVEPLTEDESNWERDPVPHDRLFEARAEISSCMDDILKCFKPGAKITVLVRTPGNDNADLMLTNDDIEQIVAMVERSKGRPES